MKKSIDGYRALASRGLEIDRETETHILDEPVPIDLSKAAFDASVDSILGPWRRYVRNERPDLRGKKNRKRARAAYAAYIDDVLTNLSQLA